MMPVDLASAAHLTDVLAQVEQLVKDVIAPNADEVDAEGRWPVESLRALQGAGLGGLVVPIQSGGLGFGLEGLIRVCELIGRGCASSALCFGMHCVGTAVIAAKATPSQRRRYLEPICRGEHLTTLALSEPGTGSHFYIPETALNLYPDGHYRLDGAKSFVTNGGYADSYVVSTAAEDPGAPAGEFSLVVLPEGSPGMSWGQPWNGLGMRGNASRNLEMKNVVLPRDDLLGKEGDEIWYMFQVVAPYFLAAMAGTYLGIAGTAVEEARQHMVERFHTHSGRSLGQVGVLQHRLGTIWSNLERTRRLVYFAGHETDVGGPDALAALCSAKAEVADCAVEVVNEAMTLMGGRAYGYYSLMGRLLRDARASHVMAPTTDMLRTWTGRILLNLPIVSE